MYTVGIITISDKGFAGEREDKSGPTLKAYLEEAGFRVPVTRIVPDEIGEIKAAIIDTCDNDKVDLILTTGGTGLSPRDVTPEATKEVIEKEAPGFSEAIRIEGLKTTPLAMISRGVSGIRGKTLIINLPGSLRAVKDGLGIILKTIPHALDKLKGNSQDCGKEF